MSERLESTAKLILDKYDGDINKLRETASKDFNKEKKLLKEFKVSFMSSSQSLLFKMIAASLLLHFSWNPI